MPAVNALWETGYGQAILVKTRAAHRARCAVASGNLLRSQARARRRARPARARRAGGAAAADAGQRRGGRRGRHRVRGGGAVEPRAAAAGVRAAELGARARSGRVASRETVNRAGYVLQVLVSPNKAAAPDSFALRITKGGQAGPRRQRDAFTFNHPEMQMPQQEYQLTETQPGVYSRAAPALVMVGSWGAELPDHPQGRAAVHRADRRPGRRMRRTR